MSALSRIPCGPCALLSPAGGRACNHPSFPRPAQRLSPRPLVASTTSDVQRCRTWSGQTGGHCRAQGAFELAVVARLAWAKLMGMGSGVIMSQSRRGPQPQTTHLEKGGRRLRGSTLVVARLHSITLDVEAHEIRPSSLDIGQVTEQRPQ